MKRKTVSLCMIARDEEACIGKAIKSALALVDEIVVVDTGSKDNTRIIAEGYGARIIDEVWRDDFAAARNAGLAAAACDWVLVLDCDEQLQSIRPVDFQRLLIDPGVAGYRLQVSDGAEAELGQASSSVRLFRNHPDVRYRYPVREQVAPSLGTLAATENQVIVDAPLLVMHDAGNADARSRKRDRNLRLLRQAMDEYPHEAYYAHQLGREGLQWLDGEVLPVAGLVESRRILESAWRQVTAMPDELRQLVAFGRELAGDLVSVYLAAGDHDLASEVVELAQSWWPGKDQLCLHGARVAVAGLLQDRTPVASDAVEAARDAIAVLDQVAAGGTAADARVLVLNRFRLLGDVALLEHKVSEAAEAYEQALDHDQDYAAAWVGLADCARLAGDRKRALRLYLRAITASEWCVQAWERGCRLLDELGFHDNATSWRVKVEEQFPACENEQPVLA